MVSLLRHVPAHDLGSLGPRISTSLYLHKPLVNEAESVCRLTFHSLRKFNSRAFCLAFVFVSASAVLISLLPASVQMCKIQKKEEKKKKSLLTFLTLDPTPAGPFSGRPLSGSIRCLVMVAPGRGIFYELASSASVLHCSPTRRFVALHLQAVSVYNYC